VEFKSIYLSKVIKIKMQ